MFGYKLTLTSAWNKASTALVALVILMLIATDRRPDDTSIQMALAAGALGLFAIIDQAVNRAGSHPVVLSSRWLIPGLTICFLVICTLSAAWAGEPVGTLEVMAVAWVLFVAWLALRAWTDLQPLSAVKELLRWICISIMALSALLFSEVATGQYIHDYLVNSWGMSMSIPNYYIFTETHIYVSTQFLSQHVESMTCLFWPILFAIYISFGRWATICMAAFTLLTVYSVVFSINQTAMLALALGTAALIAAALLPRISTFVTATAYSLTVMGIVPLTYVAYDVLHLQSSGYIPPTGQARIPIWYNVASSVGESPFFGHGVVHLRALLHTGKGFIWEHAHSHNVFLQTWYEVGAFGSIIILLIGLVFLKLLYGLPNKSICFGLAGFVTLFTSLSTSAWELWVPWHLGLLTLVAMIVTLLKRVELGTLSIHKKRT